MLQNDGLSDFLPRKETAGWGVFFNLGAMMNARAAILRSNQITQWHHSSLQLQTEEAESNTET